MTTDVILVNLAALAAIAWIVWYFWLSERPGAVAATEGGGVQEVFIRVRGGYDPDLIVLSAARRARLHFQRRETAACSEMVTIPDLGISRHLPTGETVTVDLERLPPGEYEFACQMGMLRGKIVVTGESEPNEGTETG